ERLDDLRPVVIAVTGLIGGRLVGAIVTVTKVKATAAAATLAYEAAVVRLAFQSGVAAGAQYTLATAATAATRAMSLVGGPAGVAMLAGGALLYFLQQAESAEEKTARLGAEVDRL